MQLSIEAFAKRLFRDPAHAKTAIVVISLAVEIIGVTLVLTAKFLR